MLRKLDRNKGTSACAQAEQSTAACAFSGRESPLPDRADPGRHQSHRRAGQSEAVLPSSGLRAVRCVNRKIILLCMFVSRKSDTWHHRSWSMCKFKVGIWSARGPGPSTEPCAKRKWTQMEQFTVRMSRSVEWVHSSCFRQLSTGREKRTSIYHIWFWNRWVMRIMRRSIWRTRSRVIMR